MTAVIVTTPDQLQAIIAEAVASGIAAATARQTMNVTDVAAMLGIGDEWLEAWWLEQSFGEHPMKAGLKGEPLRIITTLSELLALVRDWDDLVSEVAHG